MHVMNDDGVMVHVTFCRNHGSPTVQFAVGSLFREFYLADLTGSNDVRNGRSIVLQAGAMPYVLDAVASAQAVDWAVSESLR